MLAKFVIFLFFYLGFILKSRTGCVLSDIQMAKMWLSRDS